MTDVISLVRNVHEASRLINASEQTMSYARKVDVRAHNKRMSTLWGLLNELASSSEGRLALEALLDDESDPSLRIPVATVVKRWDGFAARDALEEVVASGGGRVVRPMTMRDALDAPWRTARNAALALLDIAKP